MSEPQHQPPTTAPVALITGGARRVGRAIAQRLASAGFDIAITYLHSAPQAAQLTQELQSTGRRALAIQADLTDPEPATSLIHQSITQTFGRLDVLVNNASLYEPDSLDSVDLSRARRHWAIHVEAPLLLCHRFAPLLRAARGRVINMVDLLAETPWPHYLTYCASKAALANLTLSLARELAPEVTVNGIAPGVVDWPDDMPQDQRDKYLQRVPLRKAGTPDDVAALVCYLSTTNSYMTGQVLHMDGGRSIT